MQIWAIKNNQTTPMEMLKLGEFDSRIDKDLLAGKILEVCGAMTPVHNTTDSYTYFHNLFFKMWGKQITRLLDATNIEYEPLENYRRVEEKQAQGEEISIGTDTSEYKGNDVTTKENNSSAEQKTSAYNEDLYQPQAQEIITEESTNTDESESNTKRDSERTKDYTTKESNVIKGMNGLFTPQQLIQQEIELAQYNIYQWIVTKYMEELFICVF